MINPLPLQSKLHDFLNKIEYRQISKTVLQIIISGTGEKLFSIQLHRRANDNDLSSIYSLFFINKKI